MDYNNHLKILVLSGFDPSGGAGLIADIETINALGGRASGIISCQTVQNNSNAIACTPTDINLLKQQFGIVGDLNQFDAIKIGLVPSIEIADAIAEHLPQADCPIVLDPIISASGGYLFCNKETVQYIAQRLLPLCDIATPNKQEAVQLANIEQQPALALLARGAKAILVSSEYEENGHLYHCLYQTQSEEPYTYACKRLSGNYHGSGCTFASALAVYLARKVKLKQAINDAQDFTYQCLLTAQARGFSVPLRSKQGTSKIQ